MNIQVGDTRFPSADGKSSIYAKKWVPEAESPRFCVQIVHGMCEYVDRYDQFARFLCQMGAAVYGDDHLGHGHTKEDDGYFGYFAAQDGEKILVEDLHTLNQDIHHEYPGVPVILFGHSMGSFLARYYTARYGDTIHAAIYSGTAGPNPQAGLAKFLAQVGCLFGRAKKPAELLTKLAFGKYNDRIENARTPNDWLTRDTDIVDKYNQDPWNTFKFTNRGFYDLMSLLQAVSGEQWAEQLPKDMGYYLISGDADPVGDYGRGVERVLEWMRKAGIGDVTLKLYPGARHELTNETNKDEVMADIASWIEAHLPAEGQLEEPAEEESGDLAP